MKIIVILVCFLMLLIPIQTALATSGACSWHNGVNCSAESDWDGSVICNDGWRDSLVAYSNTDLCEEDCPWGYTDEFKQMIVDCLDRQVEAQNESNTIIADLQSNLLTLEQTEADLKQEKYDIVMNNPDSWSGLSPSAQRNLRQQYTTMYEGLIDDVVIEQNSIIDQINEEMSKTFTTECDFVQSYSYLYCNYNPTITSTLCPSNASLTGGVCLCDTGYQWDTSQTTCIQLSKNIIPTTTINIDDNTNTDMGTIEKFYTVDDPTSTEGPTDQTEGFFRRVINKIVSIFSKLKFW